MNTQHDFSLLASSFPGSFEERKKAMHIEIKEKKEKEDLALFLIHKSSLLPNSAREIEQNALLLHGCLYKVWLMAIPQQGKLIIAANSDSRIMRGALVLLLQMLSGLPFKDIIEADISFLYRDISNTSFPTARSTSLRNVEDRIKMFARQMLSEDLLKSIPNSLF